MIADERTRLKLFLISDMLPTAPPSCEHADTYSGKVKPDKEKRSYARWTLDEHTGKKTRFWSCLLQKCCTVKKSNISTQTSLVRHAAAPFPVFFERENPVKQKTKTAKHKRAVYVLDLSGHLQRLSALMK